MQVFQVLIQRSWSLQMTNGLCKIDPCTFSVAYFFPNVFSHHKHAYICVSLSACLSIFWNKKLCRERDSKKGGRRNLGGLCLRARFRLHLQNQKKEKNTSFSFSLGVRRVKPNGRDSSTCQFTRRETHAKICRIPFLGITSCKAATSEPLNKHIASMVYSISWASSV